MLTIVMDGGLIQSIISDRKVRNVRKVLVIDYDIEGTSDTVMLVPNDAGEENEAVVDVRPVEQAAVDLTRIHYEGMKPPAWLGKGPLTPPDPGDRALVACQMLVNAYANGKRNGGEIDWSDVDFAWEAAKRALRAAQPPR